LQVFVLNALDVDDLVLLLFHLEDELGPIDPRSPNEVGGRADRGDDQAKQDHPEPFPQRKIKRAEVDVVRFLEFFVSRVLQIGHRKE
jgi:hypothetical protein